jgi:hypothetical protein
MVGQRPRVGKPAEEFQFSHTGDRPDQAALRAWEFLRSNPLTSNFFRPISQLVHPFAIGRIECMELTSIAAELRELILRADEVVQPYERQREHEKNMKAIARFYQFCAAHRATNSVAVTTYGQTIVHYFRNLDPIDEPVAHPR